MKLRFFLFYIMFCLLSFSKANAQVLQSLFGGSGAETATTETIQTDIWGNEIIANSGQNQTHDDPGFQEGGSGETNDVPVPIDGGVSLLLTIGVAHGYKRYKKLKSKSIATKL